MALIALAGICLVGCKKDQKDFYLSDLQGLWQNDQTTTWYDVTEDDLFDPETYHGNGWFQYKLEKNGDFTYINMMDNKGADVPKSFKMITLTSSKMTFQNDLKEKKNFTKQ